MLTIFNRRELITTSSLEEQSKLRTLLSAHNIPYTIKLINRSSPPLSAIRVPARVP